MRYIYISNAYSPNISSGSKKWRETCPFSFILRIRFIVFVNETATI